jgi:transglutaminase-like putative cysteine protease
MSRILRIFRDGRKHERELRQQLPPGAQGNLETLAVMKKIVLEDSKENDLRAYVMREIIGLDKQTLPEQVNAAFYYCRDKIIYEQEKEGFETVADLWSCIYALNPLHASGDCVLKSVALATCLSYLNLKPKFVAIQQIPDVTFFNHVFVIVEINGVSVVLDPTPPQFRVGDELQSFSQLYYQIF